MKMPKDDKTNIFFVTEVGNQKLFFPSILKCFTGAVSLSLGNAHLTVYRREGSI